MLFICTKFCENISKDLEAIVRTVFSVVKFAKRHNAVKVLGGVMVLVLCSSFDKALYLHQVLQNISKGFRVIEQTPFP